MINFIGIFYYITDKILKFWRHGNNMKAKRLISPLFIIPILFSLVFLVWIIFFPQFKNEVPGLATVPFVWTLHDCWAFTGHCAHFDYANCYKWETHCQKCPERKSYPKSIFIDNSYNNYETKKKLFTGLDKLTLVTPSEWLTKMKIIEGSFKRN